MQKWESNRNWRQLPPVEVGDIVHLKLTDGFQYLVKVIINAVGGKEITGRIEALFDSPGGGLLTGGENYSLVGKEISFRPCLIHKIIKTDDIQTAP